MCFRKTNDVSKKSVFQRKNLCFRKRIGVPEEEFVFQNNIGVSEQEFVLRRRICISEEEFVFQKKHWCFTRSMPVFEGEIVLFRNVFQKESSYY